MAGMNDNEDVTGGGMLSQEELDSLLAAASAETGVEDWTEPAAPEPSAPLPEPAAGFGGMGSLPSFDDPIQHYAADLGPEPAGMVRVKDIPLEVTVELGRTRLLIRDILDLGAGSIIELDKIAGEPVELFANGLLVARGEVVVIDDNFGVRVTEIITAAQRSGGKDAALLAA